MTEIVLQKLNKRDLDKARSMYFANCEINEICTTLSVDPETIRFYVFGEDGNGKNPTCWLNLRKKLNPTAMSMYLRDKVDILDMTAGVGVEILSTSLSRLRDLVRSGEKELNVDEISKLTKVVVDLDKIVRLEKGTATEINEFIGLTRAEAKNILENDPFAQAIPVESVELPWLKDEEIKDGE